MVVSSITEIIIDIVGAVQEGEKLQGDLNNVSGPEDIPNRAPHQGCEGGATSSDFPLRDGLEDVGHLHRSHLESFVLGFDFAMRDRIRICCPFCPGSA